MALVRSPLVTNWARCFQGINRFSAFELIFDSFLISICVLADEEKEDESTAVD